MTDKEFAKKLMEAIEEKNSWGKNELKQLILTTLIETE